ncbi:MAG: hypothetical protein ACK5MR_17570 [Cumulibacter sp.]
MEELYTALEVSKYKLENAKDLAGQTTTIKSYKTNNTTEENVDTYQTNKEETFIDNGAGEVEYLEQTIKGRTIINRSIDDLKTMFMNKTNEVVEKELYGK